MRSLKLVIASLLFVSPALYAQTFNYRFVDLTYFPSAKIDNPIDENGDGFQLRGSLPIYENFFVLTEYQNLSLDNGVDTDRLLIGAGGHWPISSRVDIVARGGIIYYKIDAGRADDDTDLWVGGRIRAIVAPQLELEGGVEYQHTKVFTLNNDTFIVGEARYNFTPQWSAGVAVNVGGDTTLFGLQGRFSF